MSTSKAKDDEDGVPQECPSPNFIVAPPARPRLLGFRFPQVPGVPLRNCTFAGRLRGASDPEHGDRGAIESEKEWRALLTTVAGELDRAHYHLHRFREVLSALKRRRHVAGGPVFGDPAPARALYGEASAYIGALRTVLDVVVFIAARRHGRSEKSADRWDASEAFKSDLAESSKYRVTELNGLRRHADWLAVLNGYRNGILHRGWHAQSFGYFAKGDSALEADDPTHNVMLVPDRANVCGGARARPHRWTFADRQWLDELIEELDAGATTAFGEVLETWGIPPDRPGSLAEEEHPTVFLGVPLVRPVGGTKPPVLPVFANRLAWKAFDKNLAAQGLGIQGSVNLRPVRPTLIKSESAFLLAYEESGLGDLAKVHLLAVADGRLQVLQELPFKPSALNGPARGVLGLRWDERSGSDVVYVLDVRARPAAHE